MRRRGDHGRRLSAADHAEILRRVTDGETFAAAAAAVSRVEASLRAWPEPCFDVVCDGAVNRSRRPVEAPMIRRTSTRAGMVTLMIAVAACSSAPDVEAVRRWPAGESARELLKVQTWEVQGEGDSFALVGLGGTSDPNVHIIRVHAQLQPRDDGRVVVDVDAPQVWGGSPCDQTLAATLRRARYE